ncbi:MAG: cobalamin-dependent protein, partial [Spirochaetales bacterium]|nr:cobalamin-dependent protein [Spirochaetales bacterium]
MISGVLEIVLVQPPVEDFYFTPHRSSALGLQSLAAAWTKRGHSCHILNFPLEKPLKKKLPIPDALTYLYPHLKKHTKEMNGTSYFSSYFRFGPSPESCLEQIKILEPRVIAVSCFAWGYAKTTLKLLELLKKHWQKNLNPPLLVVGGPGATVMPGYFTSFADLVVTGEGENAIEAIEKRAGQVSSPSCGEIVSPDPPLAFPFVWDLKTGRKNRFTATTMVTRGCPKMCSFCAN